jgi:hypothetical protein
MARTHRDRAFASLHHVLDLDWMLEAYRTTRKDGAAGIDGVTAADYAEALEVNLLDLLDRIKSSRYQAPPVRRSYIPKADGSQRPLGMPTFEDKVAQRAIVMLLEAIYEQDFLPCSYGFRPGRSAHDAVHDLRTSLMTRGMRWVLDIDIRRYFLPPPASTLLCPSILLSTKVAFVRLASCLARSRKSRRSTSATSLSRRGPAQESTPPSIRSLEDIAQVHAAA